MLNYTIVQDTNKDTFIELVNTFISEGYVAIGGVNVNYLTSSYGVEMIYTQALVLK